MSEQTSERDRMIDRFHKDLSNLCLDYRNQGLGPDDIAWMIDLHSLMIKQVFTELLFKETAKATT